MTSDPLWTIRSFRPSLSETAGDQSSPMTIRTTLLWEVESIRRTRCSNDERTEFEQLRREFTKTLSSVLLPALAARRPQEQRVVLPHKLRRRVAKLLNF
jgi:hypothetical protein